MQPQKIQSKTKQKTETKNPQLQTTSKQNKTKVSKETMQGWGCSPVART